MTKSVQIWKDYSYNWNMVSHKEIKAFQWIELLIKNQDKKVRTFEWPDTSRPKRKIGDGDNDKDKGETNKKQRQDYDADSSSDKGMYYS